jgi:DNA-binding NtrC family response regulator
MVFARWHCFCVARLVRMKKIHQKSILIIDDDTGMLRALDKVLTGAGAVVTRAQCAGDAVEILTVRKDKFDLVITDLRMPFVTGLTVVYAIHQIFSALPVIVLTAFGGADVKDECFRQGASAFLEKPLDTSELLAAVEKVFALQTSDSGTGGAGKRKEQMYGYRPQYC